MKTNDKLLHDALIPTADSEYEDDGGYMHAPAPYRADEALARVMAPAHAEPAKAVRNYDSLLNERVDGALSMLYNPDPGLPWASDALTQMVDTIKRGDLVVVTAYTGAGKTTFMQNNIEAWAAMGERVLYFGTEQHVDALTFKAACMAARVSFSDAVRGRLSPKWTRALEKAIMAQRAFPYNNVVFYPSPNPTLGEAVKAITRGVKDGILNHGIDHLGCISPDPAQARMSRWEFVMHCVATFKNLAVKLRCRIILAAQLMADETSDAAKHNKPNMKAVQGGQAVSQWADLVLGIYQPYRMDATKEEKLAVARGEADILTVIEPQTAAVAQLKHREGIIPRTTLYWVKNNRFTERGAERTMPLKLSQTEYEQDKRAAAGLPLSIDQQTPDVIQAFDDGSFDSDIAPWADINDSIELATEETDVLDATAKAFADAKAAADAVVQKKADAKAKRERLAEEKRIARINADAFVASANAAIRAGAELQAQPIPMF